MTSTSKNSPYAVRTVAFRSSHLADESADAVRSVLIAAEYLRRDMLGDAARGRGADIALIDGGKGLSLRIPEQMGADPWETRYVPVTYRLQPYPGRGHCYRLVREQAGSRITLAACSLSDLEFRFIRSASSPRCNRTCKS